MWIKSSSHGPSSCNRLSNPQPNRQMPATAPKEQWRTVRRYALSGEYDRTRRLLEEMVEKYPEDTEAAAELRRLCERRPLLCTESQRERRARLGQASAQALTEDLAKYSAHKLAATPTGKLHQLYRRLQEQLRAMSAGGVSHPTGTAAYKKMLQQELKRRRNKTARALLLTGAALLVALLLTGGTTWLLHKRAEEQLQQLERALSAQDWERAEYLLSVADSGINRLVYTRTSEITARVRSWQQVSISRAGELATQLQIYEKREAISSLSLEERADFLRRIHALPAHFSQNLLTRWVELCRPEQEKLDAQRDAFVAEIEAATAAPTLTGQASADSSLLRRTKSKLQRTISTFENAKVAFDLPEELIHPCQKLLEQTELYLADAEMLSRAEMQLRAAINYGQHLKALDSLTPRLYPPALAATQARQALPTEESICNTVRAVRFNLPQELPDTVVNALTAKGPSFCTGYPASIQQLHLMENLFTARSLRQRVYEVFRASGEQHYTEQPPTVDTGKNRVSFTLSELDPERRVDRSPVVEWGDAHAVWIRTIDATAILKTTGISRDKFFLTANLPELLGRLTSIREKECPALAKAYAYHTLLEVMRLHNAEILGLRYSPLLQEDIKSFRLMISRCKQPPIINCWLSRSSEAAEAEALCAQWFAAHTDRDYATEISRNFSRILRTRPHYLGYVDAEGKPHLLQSTSAGEKLWYLSGGRLISTPGSAPLQKPSAYSPVFAE